MLPCNAHKNDQGFTIVEILAVLVTIGILSAIAAPSFLSMFSRNKVNDALAQTRGALQEAQRESMRKSKTCKVKVPKGDDQTVSSDCFVTGNRTLKGINIDHENTETWEIIFDFKGRTNDVANAGTIILSSPDTSDQKCLVISQGIGMIRSGNYKVGATPPCQTVR